MKYVQLSVKIVCFGCQKTVKRLQVSIKIFSDVTLVRYINTTSVTPTSC